MKITYDHLTSAPRVLRVSVSGRATPDDVYGALKSIPDEVSTEVSHGIGAVLFDITAFKPAYSESWITLGIAMMMCRQHARIALYLSGKKGVASVVYGDMIDCFHSTDDALEFLISERAMLDPRSRDHNLWRNIGQEIGPDRCARCERQVVQFSKFCRRHHYEMLSGALYDEGAG